MKLSKIISYFFHPINFSIIGAFLYFLFVPKYIYKPQEYLVLIIIFIVTYISPLVLLYLLKKYKIIQSYHMVTIEERKFPVILFISISFFIGYWIFETAIADILSLFYFGYGLALIIIYLFLYFKRKASLHTVAIGGIIGFLLYFCYYYKINLIYILVGFFLLSGIIGSARLHMKAHSLSEVISGFFIGLISQIIVFEFYSI